MYKVLTLFVFVFLIASCEGDKFSELIQSAKSIDTTKIITYPYNESIFPLDIIAPTIKWKNEGNSNEYLIIISSENSNFNKTYASEGNKFRTPKEDWENLKKNPEEKIQIQLIAFNKNDKNKALAQDKIAISISKDKVEAPIIFRTVTLPFSYAVDHLETIKWRMGYISNEDKPITVLENLPVCGNCHSFSNDGKTMGMDVDYGNDKGSYALFDLSKEVNLTKDRIITWTDYKKEDGEQTFGLLSALSPCGRYSISTLKDRSVFVKVDNEEYSQLFFPIKGILAYYDKLTKKFSSLKGADDKNYVNSNPTWSPDGKTIYFARSKYYKLPEIENTMTAILPIELAHDFVDRKKLFKYDIYKVQFNDGKGGVAEPLLGASNNGKSNYFPKISPDSKWVVFNQAESFMLLMPDSKLYIMSANGGEPRLMRCNLSNMNSWHSFSPNGKWLLFASKENGIYTQLYLTHIDENGQDSPPVLLENFQFDKMAANIPEFVNIKDKSFIKIKENFLNIEYYGLQMGKNKIMQGDFAGAIKDLSISLKNNPNDYEAYNMRAIAYSELGKIDSAICDFTKCIEINPIFEAYFNCGAAYFAKGNYEKAIFDLNKSISISRKEPKAYYKRALAFYNTENYEKANADFNSYLQMNKKDYHAYLERALTEFQLGLNDKACSDLHFAKDNGITEAIELLNQFCK